MPQTGRKIAFSARQKKKQLQEKKERKTNVERNEYGIAVHRRKKKVDGVNRINQQPTTSSSNPDRNRYLLHFKRESDEEVERGKALAREPIFPLGPEAREIDLSSIYPPGLEMPERPVWNYNLSKQTLNNNEMKYFNKYLNEIAESFGEKEISFFEMNIETWRQLWRVLEMSDVVLLITDARHPALHFSPSLYNYVVNKTKKRIILIMNKIDLVPAALVLAWKNYFTTRYPHLAIVLFTSSPSTEPLATELKHSIFKRAKPGKRRYCSVGPLQLWHACREIVRGGVDLSSWKEKIEYDAIPEENEERQGAHGNDDDDDDDKEENGDDKSSKKCDDDDDEDDDDDDEDSDNSSQKKIDEEDDNDDNDTSTDDDNDVSDMKRKEYVFCRNGTLTIGCCGYPNVGKSSVINSLVGKKVVSVSRTPGHTKHFQTIKLTHNLILCDSPGLVFPSLISKPLQILSGMYPISQVREPYSCIRYVAERLPLPHLLRLKRRRRSGGEGRWGREAGGGSEGKWGRDDGGEGKGGRDGVIRISNIGDDDDAGDDDDDVIDEEPWTAYSICDAWAEQRGFLTAKAARNDVYRAGNHILRMCEQSRICLCFTPPSYETTKHELESSAEFKHLIDLQLHNKVIVKR